MNVFLTVQGISVGKTLGTLRCPLAPHQPEAPLMFEDCGGPAWEMQSEEGGSRQW